MLAGNIYFKRPGLVFLSLMIAVLINAQPPVFKIHQLKLPDEVANPENQFSAIQVYNKQLYLISESRLHEKAEAKMYVAPLSSLKKSLKDTSRILPFTRYAIRHLDILTVKMKANGNDYEGLEAAVFENNTVYLSVETETASPDCYLIKGLLEKDALVLDTSFLVAIPKFTGRDGKSIYNACYEAMVKADGNIFAFYEYNYFPQGNYVRVLDKFSLTGNQCQHNFPMQSLPFRITDITATGNQHYTAINFFYKGDGPDAVYRPVVNDSINNQLVLAGGKYKNYCRLVDLQITDTNISWKPLWEFPEELMGHNWECIAAYKNGYFLMNDKYTTIRPNKSVLLFLKQVK